MLKWTYSKKKQQIECEAKEKKHTRTAIMFDKEKYVVVYQI